MTRAAIGVALLLAAIPAAGQSVDAQIRRNQARLDSIRQARGDLESQLTQLRGRVRNISSELVNLERQRLTTTRLMTELDRQMTELNAQLDTITVDLLVARDALAEKEAVRQRRLVEIARRGSLWTFQVLLAAESFSDLLSRYKYLHLVSRQDRLIVEQVRTLRDRIASERRQLSLVQREIATNRGTRQTELSRYQELERERQRTLRQTRSTAERAQVQIAALAAAETEINTVLADLERRRTAAGVRGITPTITADSRGRLPWPADGPLAYRFGRAEGPSGTVISYQGIGIRVAEGTEVHAVANGQVAVAGPFGTYGPTVLVEHGGGFYTLYLHLSDVLVVPNQQITQGQLIGRSGGVATEEGPHLMFQIRRILGVGQQPQAVNPLDWLVARSQ